MSNAGGTYQLDGSGLNLDPDCELFLKGDPSHHSYTSISRGFIPFSFAFIGSTSVVIHNWLNKRPLYSGGYRYFTSAIVGVVLGIYVSRFKDKFLIEKDLQYYHYMTLHPEDFAPPERVLYKNYLARWQPFR